MNLVETKAYKVNITNTERIDFRKIAKILEEVYDVFQYREVYYTSMGSDNEYEIDAEEINNVAEFLTALAYDYVRVY